MPIQIPDTPKLNQIGNTASRVAPGVVQQTAVALSGFGQSLAKTGANVQSLAQKIQNAQDTAAANEFEVRVQEQANQLLADLAQSGNQYNEQDWVPMAEEMFRELSAEGEALKMSRGAKDKLALNYRKMASNYMFRIARDAAQRSIDRAREMGLLNAEMAADAGDAQRYHDIIDSLEGVIAPEEQAKMHYEGGKKIMQGQLRQSIIADPGATLKQIEAGEWDEVGQEAKAQATYKARIEANKQKRELYEEMYLGMENGDRFTSEQINQMVEAGQLSKGAAARLIDLAKSPDVRKPNPVLYAQLKDQVAKYNVREDDEALSEGTALIESIVSSGLPTTDITRLRNEYNRAASGEAPTVQSSVRSAGTEVLQQYHDNGTFGLERDIDGNPTPESERRSSDRKAKLQDEMDEWINDPANHPIDRVKLREAVDAMVRSEVDYAGAATLFGDTTPREPEKKEDPLALPQRDDEPQLDATLLDDPANTEQ